MDSESHFSNTSYFVGPDFLKTLFSYTVVASNSAGKLHLLSVSVHPSVPILNCNHHEYELTLRK